MPKVIISRDSVVIREVQLTKVRTGVGRRPYNDIVIDNLAVSGEHAVFQLSGNDGTIEDLNSTNGTYVNGKTVKKQLLQHNDVVEIGNCKIRYVAEAAPAGADARGAAVRVVSGAGKGREMALVKEVTTIGKPGVAVASITRMLDCFVFTHVDGDSKPAINGVPVNGDAVALTDGDMIEVAGTTMQFVQR